MRKYEKSIKNVKKFEDGNAVLFWRPSNAQIDENIWMYIFLIRELDKYEDTFINVFL